MEWIAEFSKITHLQAPPSQSLMFNWLKAEKKYMLKDNLDLERERKKSMFWEVTD